MIPLTRDSPEYNKKFVRILTSMHHSFIAKLTVIRLSVMHSLYLLAKVGDLYFAFTSVSFYKLLNNH